MKFQLFRHMQKWTWVLLHEGTVLANGGRYKTELQAREAIETLRKGVMRAAVVQLEK